MTENPIYDMTEPATIIIETPYYTQVNRDIQLVQRMEENDDNPTSRVHNNCISDSPHGTAESEYSEIGNGDIGNS